MKKIRRNKIVVLLLLIYLTAILAGLVAVEAYRYTQENPQFRYYVYIHCIDDAGREIRVYNNQEITKDFKITIHTNMRTNLVVRVYMQGKEVPPVPAGDEDIGEDLRYERQIFLNLSGEDAYGGQLIQIKVQILNPNTEQWVTEEYSFRLVKKLRPIPEDRPYQFTASEFEEFITDLMYRISFTTLLIGMAGLIGAVNIKQITKRADPFNFFNFLYIILGVITLASYSETDIIWMVASFVVFDIAGYNYVKNLPIRIIQVYRGNEIQAMKIVVYNHPETNDECYAIPTFKATLMRVLFNKHCVIYDPISSRPLRLKANAKINEEDAILANYVKLVWTKAKTKVSLEEEIAAKFQWEKVPSDTYAILLVDVFDNHKYNNVDVLRNFKLTRVLINENERYQYLVEQFNTLFNEAVYNTAAKMFQMHTGEEPPRRIKEQLQRREEVISLQKEELEQIIQELRKRHVKEENTNEQI
ncbi:MAG: hypothetical protein J7L47_03185 [Candidatus Odinarchaeota archaeon]|nr:hypothetical protein [Candidatus Odinarchaeota archaeon]